MNQIIGNYEIFCDFKESDDRGYGCLSRIFIKLPFLNLADLETTDKTIYYFIKKKLDSIHINLMQQLKAGNLDEIDKEIELSEKEMKDIDQKIILLTEGKK